MSDIQVKPNPGELQTNNADHMVNLYQEAFQAGRSLSAHLEHRYPSRDYNDGLDGFTRVVAAKGITLNSVEHLGIRCSSYRDFEDKARGLIPEWIARLQRSVQTGRPFSTRDLYGSGDGTPGSWERPYAEAQSARWDQQIEPAIPLREVIALTSTVDSDAYRAYYLQYNEEQAGAVRVGEGATVPEVKLVGTENVVDLYKYGRSLVATYEQLRRQRLDKIALHIRLMAVQAEVDKLATIINIMVNGDGNQNGATVHPLSNLDSEADGSLTLKAWLAFKMKFANPYMATFALAQEEDALALMMLNTGSGNVPLVTIQSASGFGSFTQINRGLSDGMRLGWSADVPADKIIAADKRFAIERVVEAGSTIAEIERFTRNQTQSLTITEVEGYAIIDKNATRVLNLAA